MRSPGQRLQKIILTSLHWNNKIIHSKQQVRRLLKVKSGLGRVDTHSTFTSSYACLVVISPSQEAGFCLMMKLADWPVSDDWLIWSIGSSDGTLSTSNSLSALPENVFHRQRCGLIRLSKKGHGLFILPDRLNWGVAFPRCQALPILGPHFTPFFF